MADTVKVELITRDFNRMLAELAAIDATVEFRDVVLGITERVLAGASRATESADPAKIRKNSAAKEFTTFNGKRYKVSNRFPDAIWGGVDNKRKDGLATKLNARGLARQSWQHVGASFGASINAPGYVTAANFKGKQYAQDGTSREAGSGEAFQITIENSSPIVQAAGGRSALTRSMRGETRYFETNMEKRAFATLESRVKKYPGVFARRGI